MSEGERLVRLVPDVTGLDKEFDYIVPQRLLERIEVGSLVRIDLKGRRVGAWVTALDPTTPAGDLGPSYDLKPIARWSGIGPDQAMVELGRWAAWRYAGRLRVFLKAASPPGRVDRLPAPPGPRAENVTITVSPELAEALAESAAVLRVPPAADRYPVVAAALSLTPYDRDVLVLCPSGDEARRLAARLERAGVPVVCVAHNGTSTQATGRWARAAAGGVTVVGSRAAAFAPMPRLGRVICFDEHDQAYQEESSPTWHAREVAAERARRAGAQLLVVSSIPTLESSQRWPLFVPSRSEERKGWPALVIVDRREEDPTAGLITEPLVRALRRDGKAVCILNRKGRSQLSACNNCAELIHCMACRGPLTQPDESHLKCRVCGTERPIVCGHCGATRFKNLRPGVTRMAEDLAALLGEPVDEISSDNFDEPFGAARVTVGTEAALHRVRSASTVAFLDFDQELMVPRERASEQALTLLVRAARLVRGRVEHGRVLVQTRQPEHPVLAAAVHANPGPLGVSEAELRAAFGLAPFKAIAVISGPAGTAFVEALAATPVEIQKSGDRWRVRADDHKQLCDALASVERPPGRLRIEVDPLRS